jgi:hypothetical protein
MKKNLSFTTFVVSTVLFSTPVNVLAEVVSQSNFKGIWPLTVEEGTLLCNKNAVTFKTKDGKVYGVNGTAKTRGAQPIEPIWANDPELPGTKLNLSDLLQKGLSLCGEAASNKTVPETPQQPADNTTKEWYVGGTLHKGTGKDWRTATDSNRLATAADFVAKAIKSDLLNITFENMDDLKHYAVELSTCLTEFLKTELTDTRSVADSATMCVVTMGWIK